MPTTCAAQADVRSNTINRPIVNATRMPLLKGNTVPHFKLDRFFIWLACCAAHDWLFISRVSREPR